MADSKERSKHLAHLSLEELHHLASRLGAYLARPDIQKPLKIARPHVPETVRPICEGAGALLADWPNGLTRGLELIRSKRGHENTWKLPIAFGPIYRQIYTKLSGAQFEFVRKAFEAYLHINWKAPIARRHRRLPADAVSNHPWQPIGKAAVQSNISEAKIRRVAASGELAAHQHKLNCGRSANVVDAQVIGELAEKLRSAMTVEQAGERLGLPKWRVKQLIEDGILKTWGGAPSRGRRWLVSEDHVNCLIGIAAGVPIASICSDDAITFAFVLKHKLKTDMRIGQILSAILNGDLALIGVNRENGTLRDWVFRKDEIELVLKKWQRAEGAGYSISEAARILGVKEEVAYALVAHGTLHSTEHRTRGRVARYVKMEFIDRFQRRYAFSVQLASEMRVSPVTIIRKLGQGGFQAAGGPTIDGRYCRQYYWERTSEMEHYLRACRDPSNSQSK